MRSKAVLDDIVFTVLNAHFFSKKEEERERQQREQKEKRTIIFNKII
jgi:hypothetical protein